jgi:Leucine-rich repeat (LRR) protein
VTTRLELSGQGLTSLRDLPLPASLEYLDLYDNRLTSVPEELWSLSGLRVLNLATNRLTAISPPRCAHSGG